MPRFYVKNPKGYWNIWSTQIDRYLLDGFVPFAELKKFVIQEMVQQKIEELNTLLTPRPELNTKPFKECERILKKVKKAELKDDEEEDLENWGPKM